MTADKVSMDLKAAMESSYHSVLLLDSLIYSTKLDKGTRWIHWVWLTRNLDIPLIFKLVFIAPTLQSPFLIPLTGTIDNVFKICNIPIVDRFGETSTDADNRGSNDRI